MSDPCWLLKITENSQPNNNPFLKMSVRPLCYLLLNHWTKSNQIWCVSYSIWIGLATSNTFWSHHQGQGRCQKVKYQITITKSISKILYQKLRCCLTDKSQTRFLSWCLGHTPEDLRAPGCPGDQNVLHMIVWHIKLTGMVSRTECK